MGYGNSLFWVSAQSVGIVEYTDCKAKTPTNECLEYDIKQSDGEPPVMLER